jgi:hypothetical protein
LKRSIELKKTRVWEVFCSWEPWLWRICHRPTEVAKEENFQAIKNLYGEIDFKLLLNEHTYIEKGEDKIALIGVENGVKISKRRI